MKSSKPALLLIAYYFVLGVVLYGLFIQFPNLHHFLPLGGNEIVSTGMSELMTGRREAIQWNPVDQSIRLVTTLIVVLLLMEPIVWVYLGVRRRKGREQSFIIAVLLLPVVVAGIVMIVQNSLALAFSLAGIVAAVRFRLTLDDTLDAIYIFVAIGVGLAAGIAAMEIAFVITLFFNLIILMLWKLDYAEDATEKRWFSRSWMQVDPKSEDLAK